MTRLLPEIYDARFDEREVSAKAAVWREIGAYLQQFVVPNAPVVDIACDRGHLINAIAERERWASDIRDVGKLLPGAVRFVHASGLDLDKHVPDSYFGTAFMSNYLEHLESSDAVIEQLEVVRRILRPRGRVVIIQPNIRLVGPRYWDFIDHRVALTERSLLEAAELAGLRSIRLTTRFLPYSTKGRLPTHRLLVRGYLAFPPAWRLLGRQTLLVAERPTW